MPNYSDFKLLGFDKHLLMQVSATEFFIAVIFNQQECHSSTAQSQDDTHILFTPFPHHFVYQMCSEISCIDGSTLSTSETAQPKKPGSLLHSPLNYSICKAQITKYIFTSKSFTYLQKNRTA